MTRPSAPLRKTLATSAPMTLLVTLLLAQLTLAQPVLLAANPSPAYKQGVNYYNKGWYKNAIPALTKAAAASPNDAKTYAYLGKALKKQGVTPQAQQALEKSLELDPNQLDVINELAESYSWKAVSRPRAIELYRQSVEKNPNQPAIKKQLAQVLYWQGDYQEGAAVASQVGSSSDPKFLSTQAALLVANHQYEDALRVYDGKLNAAGSRDFYTKQGYAIALTKTGQADKGEQIYRSLAGMVNKNNDDQLNALAGLAYELEDYSGALAADGQIKRKTDAVRLRMARSYGKVGQSQQAINTFYGLYQEGKLGAPEQVEFGDLAFDAITTEEVRTTESGKSYRARVLKPGWQSTLPTPTLIEDLYKKAAGSGQDKTGVALRLARYYTLQPEKFTSAADYYTYVIQQDPSNTAVKQELVDYLKSARSIPGADVNSRFQDLARRFPSDYQIQSSYAEILSYDETTRPQAIEKYLGLLSAFPANRAQTEAGLNQVLEWHQPRQANIGLYQQILAADPTNLWAQRSLARAYWQDPTAERRYPEALAIYRELKGQFGTDPEFVSEYSAFLSSLPPGSMRREAIGELADLHTANPGNVDVTVSYASLLSYDGRYDKSIKLFDEALAAQPDNRKALAGRSLALIWNGQKYKAADSLKALRAQYPNDQDVAIALAQAYKAMGRYDKAINILKELRQGINSVPDGTPSGALIPAAGDSAEPLNETLKAQLDDASDKIGNSPMLSQVALIPSPYDYQDSSSLARHLDRKGRGAGEAQGEGQPSNPSPVFSENTLSLRERGEKPVAIVAAAVDPVQGELDRLDASLKALEQLQTRTGQDLDELDQQVNYVKQRSPLELHEQVLMTPSKIAPSNGGSGNGQSEAAPGQSSDLFGQTLDGAEGTSGSGQSYSVQNNLGQSTDTAQDPFNTTSAGNGQLSTLTNLEKELNLLMRPTLRSGFLYSQQEGNRTTNALRSFAFPNNAEISITPQVRLRGGYNYRRFWLPNTGIQPRSTFADQYTVGTTAKLFDRLTFDGDISVTQFTQSNTGNVTAQARLIADITDRIRLQAGYRRTPYETSLLSFTGFRPNSGPYAGELVGQVRENAVFAQLNMGPWKGFDLNGGYEFAWIDGNNVPNNTKNQAFASLGYTKKYLQQHTARVGVESLFFGFAKNATNGYFDLVGGSASPVVSMLPTVSAGAGTSFGGYFSPDQFYLNSLRLDLKGYWLGRILEYNVGGGIGIQNIRAGLPGGAGNRNSAAYQANAMLIGNVTDWLSLYTLAEFIDAGGLFNRFRVGGGIIVRPKIDAISPIFGK